MKKFIVIIISLAFVSYFSLGWYFSSLIVIPRRSQPDPQKINAFGRSEPIEIISEDHLKIKGSYFKNPNDSASCGVVISHGWSGNRVGGLVYAPYFWKKGCDLVIYDHRAHGESEGIAGTWTVMERKDHKAFSNLLMRKSALVASQIGWIGESWGGATVLAAAADNPEIGFVIADSPFKGLISAVSERGFKIYGNFLIPFFSISYFFVEMRSNIKLQETDIELLASQIQIPTLLIHSQSDQETGSWQSVDIAKQLNPALAIFHHNNWGSAHCKDIRDFPLKYEALIEDFITQKVANWPNL
ncbi:MAG: alpha/beta fold hydrolase [Flammeovirgaceae bacterium]|jgi:uncharacterized protein|nr:alpha/beta fold hydrolase [Flammeovirgaceae bacterium]|tara:strand:+ start:56591 stop:57490 length:900 start_codon:yes stop_codon:yes gene_type:complete